MNTKWLPIAFLVAALVFTVVDAAYFYNRLPQQVASHFDAQGRANGWSTKQELVGLSIGISLFITVLLAPMTLIAYYAPAAFVNVPNKDYWFAPEREADSRRAIADWLLWFTAATLWFLALIFHKAMAANLRQPPEMPSPWWIIGTFLAIITAMVVQLFLRFRRPRNA